MSVARRTVFLNVALTVVSLVMGSAASAEEIKLKDGTQVSAKVLQKDGENLILMIPRASIDAVDGKPLPPPVAEGTAAPEFAAVDMAGNAHTLAENRGHMTLLQFWASWCPHCRSDLPYMKELATKYRDKGFRVLTVSVDRELDKLQAFLQKEQLPYPVISAVSYPALPESYETQGIPGYFLIDAKGTITKTWRGALTEGAATGKTELEGVLAALPTASGT